jgi:hypothetical protein
MTFATMFQLDYFIFKIKLWKLPIKLFNLLYWYTVECIFQLCGSFAKNIRHQQCFQVEIPTILINNVKHVSIKGSILKYFWHLRFFSWHIVKTLTNFQLFWMMKCTKGWMKYSLATIYFN